MEYKLFLLSLYCFENYPVPIDNAEKSFKYLMSKENYDLNEIEKALEESWVVTKNDETFKNECLDFANPSIVDFLSSKKNSNSMFNRVTNQTRYLAQIMKSSGINSLYEKVGSDYDFYFDKNLYMGERISFLLQQSKIVEKGKFIELIYGFNGKYHKKSSIYFSSLYHYKSEWSELVNEFYSSKNMDAKNIFLEELLFSETNNILIDNILNNIFDIDSFSESLNSLVEEVYGCDLTQNELIDLAEEQTGVNLYYEIIYCKKQKLQDKVDDFSEIDDFLDLDGYIDSEDVKNLATKKLLEDYQDSIFKELKGTFFDSESDNFELDFSFAETYIGDIIEEYMRDLNNYDEEYITIQQSGLDTVDSILDKPLGS